MAASSPSYHRRQLEDAYRSTLEDALEKARSRDHARDQARANNGALQSILLRGEALR